MNSRSCPGVILWMSSHYTNKTDGRRDQRKESSIRENNCGDIETHILPIAYEQDHDRTTGYANYIHESEDG